MMQFPLPILSFLMASVAGALVWRVDFGLSLARLLFAGFFGIVALGALLVGLRFGYGLEQFIPVQRVLPLLGGPFLYLGFAVLAADRIRAPRMVGLHIGVAVTLGLALQTHLWGWLGFDTIIAISYAFYSAALLLLWFKGPNHLVHARLDLTPTLHRWILWAAGFLIAMLLIDSAIAISFALHRSDDAVKIISFSSVGLIGTLLLAIVTAATFAAPRLRAETVPAAPDDAAALETAAAEFLTASQLFLDTGLTIERLAKRMHVPMRSLSTAINQTKGVNVSQYVNGFRLSHAAMLLRDTPLSVTDIAAQAGFLSRSNFYREFQRSYNQSPAAYRQNAADHEGR